MYAYISICIHYTIQKNVSGPKGRAAKPQTPSPPLLRTRLSASQLLDAFRQLLPAARLTSWLAVSEQSFYQRAFTPLVTLWYLVFQRLNDNHGLSQVQEDARAGGADNLSPRGKRLSRQLRSEATTSFSDARQRLPVEVCRRALRHIADQTQQSFDVPRKFGFKLGLVDGSTTRLRPFGDIPQQFRSHRSGNAKKPPYWCLARVIGVFCWATGVVLDSAMDHPQISEQALSARMFLERCWKGWLLVGDRNFGVYSVVRAMVAAQAQALVRLTEARARKLARSAGRTLKPGLDATLDWVPSRQDQCPVPLTRTPIAGRLLAVRVAPRGFRPFILYLFTTLVDPLESPAGELAQAYGCRWNVELCLRYIKSQMDLGFLECRSADMARKEWLAGLIAYNLIRWTMCGAAALAKIPVPSLSFSRARQLLLGWCLRHSQQRHKVHAWNQLLKRIAKARLPKRRKPRPPEPRALRFFRKDVPSLNGSRAAARLQLAKTNTKS